MVSGKRVLITGAAGFIGFHLTKGLLASGADVVAIVRPSTNPWRLRGIINDIEIVRADLRQINIDDLQRRLSTIDVVYHVGAAGVDPSNQDHASIVESNVMGTLRLLQLARLLKVDRFVYCGSCFEYGRGSLLSEDTPFTTPISEYAASKMAAYLLVNTFGERYGLPVTSLRPFNVYGPFEASYRLIPHTIIRAINKSNIELTGGHQTRDFIFVEDVVEAFVAAAALPEAIGQTFNVCTGMETSVRNVVSQIIALTGETVTPVFGALAYRDGEISNLSGDPTRANAILGWKASTTLDEGLSRTIQWFRSVQGKLPVYDWKG